PFEPRKPILRGRHDGFHFRQHSRLSIDLRGIFPTFNQHRYSAVQPPSSTRAEPVISEEASDARKTMAPVSSSSWPSRPSLIFASTSSRNALFAKKGRVIGVSRNVGPRLF